MKTHYVALALIISTGIISGCVGNTVAYAPAYGEVYTADYDSYPYYDWNYGSDYYYPVYNTIGWGRGYYGGWNRGGWGGHRGGGRR